MHDVGMDYRRRLNEHLSRRELIKMAHNTSEYPRPIHTYSKRIGFLSFVLMDDEEANQPRRWHDLERKPVLWLNITFPIRCHSIFSRGHPPYSTWRTVPIGLPLRVYFQHMTICFNKGEWRLNEAVLIDTITNMIHMCIKIINYKYETLLIFN